MDFHYIDYSRIQFIEDISKSQSCKVQHAKLKSIDGTKETDVAAKTYIDFKTSEIKILAELKHKNVIKFIGASKTGDDGRNILVMEYAPGGNLYDYLRKQNDRLTFDHALEWAKQCGNAVAYLSCLDTNSLKIVHRDIKSPNYLLSNEYTKKSLHTLKLCDFGISHKTKASSTTTFCTISGYSNRWAAPEVLRKPQNCSTPSDIYSLAVVIWELFTGEIPYNGCDNGDILMNILTGVTLNVDGIQNESISRMLKKCWSLEKSDRLGIRSVLEKLDKATEVTEVETDVAGDSQPSINQLSTYLAAALTTQNYQKYEAVPFTPRKSTPQSPDRIVTDSEFLELSRHFGIYWKEFGLKLGFTQPEIDVFEMNNKLNVKDAIFNMLNHWRSKFGYEATVGALVGHLDNFQHIDPEKYQFLIDNSKKS